ncbi:Ig-like domain-containing protein [Pseudomonas thivervalensis]|uniref:Ig-like domain-containing protein n=1 Tax=Pseudomonas thivervalensis TaxID=86265 RepID=UPI0020966F6B|nr:Ig-like domain-containing protein [Pseudomonas thivervalensis]
MTDSSTTADQTVLVLYPPRLPRATTPVTGAVYGVPKHIYDLEPMGCTVEVGAYGEQARGDTVSINLNGELALDSRQTQDINDTVTLYIPHGKLLPGIVNRLTYTVTRGSENLGTSEPPLEILYNSIRPGIEDTTPGDNAHSELVLLLPDEIKNGVGPGFTRATVCVAYPYCRAYDRIRLNCNGHDVYHTVTVTEAPAPPAHGSATPTTVCFEVTSADLRDDPEFRFSFTVNDQLNNSPDPDAPWSAVHTVDVDQAGSRLPQPIPREIASDAGDDPSIIDLDKLGANPLLLIVLTGDSRFMPDDTVEATYVVKVAGQPDVVVPATGTVETDGLGQKQACVLTIPNDKVIAGSTVEASYRLLRSTALVGTSKIARATVIGVRPLSIDPSEMKLNRLNYYKAPWPRRQPEVIDNEERLASGGMPPYTYTSSNPDVATVRVETGVVQGLRNGTSTITVTDSDRQTASYDVRVSRKYEIAVHGGPLNAIEAYKWLLSIDFIYDADYEFAYHNIADVFQVPANWTNLWLGSSAIGRDTYYRYLEIQLKRTNAVLDPYRSDVTQALGFRS